MYILKITRPTGVTYYAGWDNERHKWAIDASRKQARPLIHAAAKVMMRHLTDEEKLITPEQCEMVSLSH